MEVPDQLPVSQNDKRQAPPPALAAANFLRVVPCCQGQTRKLEELFLCKIPHSLGQLAELPEAALVLFEDVLEQRGEALGHVGTDDHPVAELDGVAAMREVTPRRYMRGPSPPRGLRSPASQPRQARRRASRSGSRTR